MHAKSVFWITAWQRVGPWIGGGAAGYLWKGGGGGEEGVDVWCQQAARGGKWQWEGRVDG